MEHENEVRVRPKATHEVVVRRAEGGEEKVLERTLSDEEAHALLEMVRRQDPKGVAEMEKRARERKLREQQYPTSPESKFDEELLEEFPEMEEE